MNRAGERGNSRGRNWKPKFTHCSLTLKCLLCQPRHAKEFKSTSKAGSVKWGVWIHKWAKGIQ